jgi:hypothetical protein
MVEFVCTILVQTSRKRGLFDGLWKQVRSARHEV